MKRVHAQLDEENLSSLQDAYYLVGQIIGMKLMRKFGIEYEFEYGMDMVAYRNKYGSVVISASGGIVSISINANGKKQDSMYDKDELLDNIVSNIFGIWQSMLPVADVA